MSDLDGVWKLEIGFTDYLQIVTTNNYNAIANLHTLQITTAHAKTSQSAFTSRFLVTDINNRDSSVSVLASLLSDEYPTTLNSSKSKLFYEWRLTANQFVLVPSPSRLTIRVLFFNWTPAVIVLMEHPVWREDIYASY
jgi:hypothetical protein